jgi:nitrogen fixation/metabolism regulation signal transduction histidine kinase
MVTQQFPSRWPPMRSPCRRRIREYQQRALAREGLRKMYIGTLTLTLILAVFGALLLAMTLSNQLAQPLLLLAQGVRRVAEGDLSAKPVVDSRDELGGLTRSFAHMIRAAVRCARDGAKGACRRSSPATTKSADHPQTNLTDGRDVFDPPGSSDTVNPGATRSCACHCRPTAAGGAGR